MALAYDCSDFLLFQETLKKMREVDDRIIYALNTSIPTESFKGQLSATETCKDLYGTLNSAHADRSKLIKNCIAATANRVKELKAKKDASQDDIVTYKNFKSEQRKLRSLQSELNVEDIVKERTQKTFHERCRPYFKEESSL